jgi:DNA-binding transcriptional MerR regulator
MMKPNELAQWLNIATATIRLWAGGEYGRYLSPTGAGGDGRARLFSEQDARIMALINDMKMRGSRREEIHTELQRLQAEDWRDLPEMPTAPIGVKTERLYPEEAVKQITIAQQSSASAQIAALQTRIDELKQELAAERERHESALTAEREKSERLLRELAEAQTELRLWREGWRKPE